MDQRLTFSVDKCKVTCLREKYDRKLAATSHVSDPEATVDSSLKVSTQCSASEG